MAFDLGCLIGNVLLSYLVLMTATSNCGGALLSQEVDNQEDGDRGWLLTALGRFWNIFSAEVKPKQLSSSGSVGSLSGQSRPDLDLIDLDLDTLWRDSLGFAGICMIRLTIGRLHFPPLEALPSGEARVDCSGHILRLARVLLKESTLPADCAELRSLITIMLCRNDETPMIP